MADNLNEGLSLADLVTRALEEADATEAAKKLAPGGAPLQDGSWSEFVDFLGGLDISGTDAETLSTAMAVSFVRHTEPETTHSAGLISIDSNGGATSRKAGNFLLNWRKWFDHSPDLALATVGGVDAGPYVRGLIGLYVWNKVWRSTEEPISEREAVVIEVLWANKNRQNEVEAATVLELTNESRERHDLPELSAEGVNDALHRLEDLRCIKWKANGMIWLREWVRKSV